jgi:threonine dehydratase
MANYGFKTDNLMHPTMIDIEQPSARIRNFVHRTPVLTSQSLNSLFGGNLFFKCENFQKAGSFKMRGATNAILQLDERLRSYGVATHSSGNHAQAVALAARLQKIAANVVMPDNASKVKVDAVKGYGAEITFCQPNLKAREEGLRKVVEKTGAAFIHPYDNYHIIGGQATATAELLKDVPNLDIILAPVGGGGLLSGTALAAHYINSNISVFGCEPEGADDAYRSFNSDRIFPSEDPKTIADGLLTSLGTRNYPIIKKFVSDIWLANDAEIIEAMILVWERLKIVIEPSSAVPLAALFRKKDMLTGKKVGIILSGGNYDVGKILRQSV